MGKATFIARGLPFAVLAAAFVFGQNRPGPDSAAGPRGGVSIVTPTDAPVSLRALVALSPVVVVGTCEKELPGRFIVASDPTSDLVTDRVVRIDRVLRGTLAEGARIAVQELGGTLRREGKEPIRQEIVDQRPLRAGQRYLLLLRPRAVLDHDEFDGRRLTITGIWAGSFLLEAGVVRVARAAEPGLRGFDGQSEGDVLARAREEIAAAPR